MKVFINDVQYIKKPEEPTAAHASVHEKALNLYFDFDGDEIRVKDYLKKLLQTLWDEQDSFSGKHPFGNSDWEYDLYVPLANAGFISTNRDSEGDLYFNSLQLKLAHAFVSDLILFVFQDK